ncbi:hypothetical protein [Cellulomonas edaphi]|uniref:LPXTG cell wall anchor domain-containing protein n=1 Tax=Cellulomonas edaphi TaxID=3053468 RepID=A0ABT7S2S8_9CELL|nr:hypothetical protein [Cellulomons edaphi]MDM7829930.1 hypothetical protein [Cellulomons edaphi]
MTTPGFATGRARRGSIVAAALLAVALVGVGGWLLWRASRTAAYGWFAYSPMSGVVTTQGHTTSARLGLALLAIGLLGLGGVGGYVLGRRRPRA